MGWNGEDRANDAVAAGPVAMPLGVAGPFDRTLWFDRLAALHWAGVKRSDARGAAGGAQAWLPLVEPRPGHCVSLANWYSFVHRPLFAGTRDTAAQRFALIDLFARLRDTTARITLYPVPETDGSAGLVATALREAGWWVHERAAGDSHWLAMDDMDHDRWWQSRPGELRSTVARKSRKQQVVIRISDQFRDDDWRAFADVYAASWKPEEGNAALLHDFARLEGASGRLRLGLAQIDGVSVAAQFWTVENGCAYIHKLAHVQDEARASPGTLLTAAMFRHVMTVDGVRRVDFGTGNDPYKRDWMNRHNRLWQIDAYNPARPAAWLPALRQTLADWRDYRKDRNNGSH
jgi:hypothetical protein